MLVAGIKRPAPVSVIIIHIDVMEPEIVVRYHAHCGPELVSKIEVARESGLWRKVERLDSGKILLSTIRQYDLFIEPKTAWRHVERRELLRRKRFAKKASKYANMAAECEEKRRQAQDALAALPRKTETPLD